MARLVSRVTNKDTEKPKRTPAVAAATIVEEDAAHYTGWSRSYFRKARRLGLGPAYVQVGRSIRYQLTDLDAWLADHRVSNTA